MTRCALVAVLLAADSFADSSYGAPFAHQVTGTDVQRIGAGPLAAAPTAQFGVENGFADSPTAVLFYVGAIHAPGDVALNILEADGGRQFVAAQQLSVGWNEWALPASLPLAFNFELAPDAGVEFSLEHMVGPYWFDSQTGHPDAVELFFFRLPRTFGLPDTTAIFRFPARVDPLAEAAGCPLGQRDALRGRPYVHLRPVPLAPSQTQRFLWPELTVPVRMEAVTFSGGIDGGYAGVSLQLRSADGGQRTLPVSGDIVSVLAPFDSFGAGDAGFSDPFEIRVVSDGGKTLSMFDVGVVTDPCHPAVRASFGGNLARAENQPLGSDLSIRAERTLLAFGYDDVDGDGYRGPARWDYSSGLAADAGSDCDDHDPLVNPGAIEHCDGVDTDCSGVADDLDRLVSIPQCEKHVGVCSGAMHVASDCVGGAWATCPVSRYGASYATVEHCDGKDEDCNGVVDDAVTDAPLCAEQRGACAGTRASVCSSAAWVECTHPQTETACDGVDEDCDGLTDEADPDLQRTVACPLEHGVCAKAGATHVLACGVAGACNYGADYEPTETRCDGLDNDCDGVTDESCAPPAMTPRPCGCSTGVAAPWLIALAFLAGVGKRRPFGVREENIPH